MIVKLSISMPKTLEEFARSRVRQGSYGSVSEYFRELVRIDQRYNTAKRAPHIDTPPDFVPPFPASSDPHRWPGKKYR